MCFQRPQPKEPAQTHAEMLAFSFSFDRSRERAACVASRWFPGKTPRSAALLLAHAFDQPALGGAQPAAPRLADVAEPGVQLAEAVGVELVDAPLRLRAHAHQL